MSDLISRQAALEILDNYAEDIESGNCGTAYSKARTSMCELPSVTPERKKVKWVTKGCDLLYCSECDLPSLHPWPYCERCGSEMEVDNNDDLL